MKTSSCKAKGRNLQKWVRDLILESFPSLEADDVRSTSMGAGGEDVQLSPAARKLFPYSLECKNVEKLNVGLPMNRQKRTLASMNPPCNEKNRRNPWLLLTLRHL